MLTYSLDNGVAIVRMDDGKANALSVAMIDELLVALARAEGEAKAMVLAGRPDTCASDGRAGAWRRRHALELAWHARFLRST